MMGLSTLHAAMWLILAHDLLATAAAVLASFFIRFEDVGLAQRWRWLSVLLPPFVLFSGLVYGFFGLYKAKWRFTSLPDLFNIVRAASVLAVTLLALDYVLLAPNVYGTFFFGKITIALYWLLQIAFLAGPRVAYRYFRYTRTLQHAKAGDSTPTLVVGRTADADVLLRAIESGAVTKIRPVGILSPSPADRGQAIRGISVLGDPDDIERVVADLRNRGIRRDAAGADADRADAGSETRNVADAGAAARARHQPAAVARRGRRGAAARAGQCRGSAAAARREDRLPPPRRLREGEIDHRNRRRRIDRGRNLRPHRHLRRCRVLVIENSEPALHAVLEMLAAKQSAAAIEGRLADIRDRARIFRLMADFRPDIVFHAAALKHVPLLEQDWGRG